MTYCSRSRRRREGEHCYGRRSNAQSKLDLLYSPQDGGCRVCRDIGCSCKRCSIPAAVVATASLKLRLNKPSSNEAVARTSFFLGHKLNALHDAIGPMSHM